MLFPDSPYQIAHVASFHPLLTIHLLVCAKYTPKTFINYLQDEIYIRAIILKQNRCTSSAAYSRSVTLDTAKVIIENKEHCPGE